MLNSKIEEIIQEFLKSNDSFDKGVCKATSEETIELDSLQEAITSLNSKSIKGIEVSPDLYYYLKYKLNNYIIKQIEEKYPETLYSYPIAINSYLENYEYKIIRKGRE